MKYYKAVFSVSVWSTPWYAMWGICFQILFLSICLSIRWYLALTCVFCGVITFYEGSIFEAVSGCPYSTNFKPQQSYTKSYDVWIYRNHIHKLTSQHNGTILPIYDNWLPKIQIIPQIYNINEPWPSVCGVVFCFVYLQGLSSLGKYNNHLRDVTLSECADITDLGLQKFTQQCKDIERLDLSHCKVPLPCTTNCEKSNENLKKMILSTYTWCGC